MMSSKRGKKNNSILDDSYKPSKNADTVESKYANNVEKSKKKGNANIPLNDKNIVIGSKRKLSDSDVVMPVLKKTKKNGKTYTNVNDTDLVEEIDSTPVKTKKKEKKTLENISSTDIVEALNIPVTKKRKGKLATNLSDTNITEDVPLPPIKSKKKGKAFTNLNEIDITQELTSSSENSIKSESKKNKKKASLNENEFFDNQNDLNKAIDTLKTEQKKGRKKKAKSNKVSNNNTLIQNEAPQDDVFVEEDSTIKTEQEIDSVEITVNDLIDSESDIEKNELQFEKKGENIVVKSKEVITWPEEDLKCLIDRMEACIPENDSLAFGTRAEKLSWETIAFKEYSVEDCKKTWNLLQKQIRRYRLLKEVLVDAKEWINAPKLKKKKAVRHPDMPRKPLSAYFIYFLQKKDIFSKSHPGLDATEISKMLSQEYKTLPPEKKLKYENLAAKRKKEYEQKVEEFYQTHPEVPRIDKSQRLKPGRKPKPEKPPKPVKERIPKRPPPPFHYYYLSELENEKDVEDKAAFKELCKDRWKNLPDEKKVVWINIAEAEYAKYEDAFAKYLQNHPELVPAPHKSILTKEEMQIKDRVAGKPSKPPGSAYNLFARVLLQSEDIKDVPFKDRLNFVSNQWKNCPDQEKNQYRDLSAKLNEKYRLEYATYLQGLPEENRKLEIEKNMPKRRKSESVETEKKEKSPPKKKSEKKPPPGKLTEPEQPPISAFKYFASLYNGEEPVAQAWKALSSEQKRIYEDELVKKKQAYIVDFEKFLKSLTKEELEAFSKSRNRIKTEPEDEEDEVTATSDDSETEDSAAESGQDEDDSELI